MRRRHNPTCGHCPRVRALGREFQCWRASWEAQREEVAIGYAAEERAYADRHAAPTFKHYLIAMAGTGWPMSGRQPRRRLLA